MGSYDIVDGCLISLAKEGSFGVVLHCCNCFNNQGKGISYQMNKEFGSGNFPLEQDAYFGVYNKMGQIDYKPISDYGDPFFVVNMYTQFKIGQPGHYGIPTDYDALRLCLRKVNYEFGQGYIGLPWNMGSDLGGGGDWDKVEQIIKEELKDCYVTAVKLKR